MTRRRLLVLAIVALLAIPTEGWSYICFSWQTLPPRDHPTFHPATNVIRFRIDDYFQGGIRDCIRQGVLSWASVEYFFEEVPSGETLSLFRTGTNYNYPYASWYGYHGAYWLDWGIVWIADNIWDMVGGDCRRLRKIVAHEVGHALGLGEGAPHSIMRQLGSGPWWGLDDPNWPDLPTDCDKEAARIAKSYTGPSFTDPHGDGGAGLVTDCGPGIPDVLYFLGAPTGQNHPPSIHVHWPAQDAMYAAPFSGTVDLHWGDLDGYVNRLDYFLNGQLFHTAIPAAEINFNIGPSATWTYNVEVAAYDTGGTYRLSPVRRFYVCSAPPTAPPQWLQHSVSGSSVNLWWDGSWYGPTNAWAVVAYYVPSWQHAGTWTTSSPNFTAGPIGSGTYYVYVHSGNPCGWSATGSPGIYVTVP